MCFLAHILQIFHMRTYKNDNIMVSNNIGAYVVQFRHAKQGSYTDAFLFRMSFLQCSIYIYHASLCFGLNRHDT